MVKELASWNTRWLVGAIVNIAIANVFLHYGVTFMALFAAFAGGASFTLWLEARDKSYNNKKNEDDTGTVRERAESLPGSISKTSG